MVTVGALLGVSSAAAQDILPRLEPEGEPRTVGTNELPRPVWMAVIADGQGVRVLAGEGDPIFRGGEPHPVGVVRTIAPVDLTLLSEGGRVVRALPGRPIPGARDLVLQETVLVKTLGYRQRVVARGGRKLLGGDQYLMEVRGTRAILQRDVEPSPSPQELLQQRLAAIQFVENGPRVWQVSARDVLNAMESGEAILTDALKNSRIDLSRDWGVGLEVKTPLAEARLDSRGVVITSPNLAARAGLQVGDRILMVNGTPIGGYTALVRVYRNIKSNPSIRMVDLLIERDEKPLTLTYQIR